MQARILRNTGIIIAVIIAAAWLFLTRWEYGAKTWGFRLTHQVIAVHDVKKDGPSMPYTYRDVYFVTTPGNAEADVKACAAAFGHDITSETQFTRCHAFLTVNGAQRQADNAATCEHDFSEQMPYMDAESVKVMRQKGQNCDLG